MIARVIIAAGLAAASLPAPPAVAAQNRALRVPVIATRAPVYLPLAALHGGERFPQGAQLVLWQNDRSAPLVEGFAATADASVAFDGSAVLFAGKRSMADKWSIWELRLADRSVRQVLQSDADMIRPLYLPGGRLVYARNTAGGYRIETAALDGSAALPLTYMAAGAVPDDVLADGRILFQAAFPLGTDGAQGAAAELFLVYSDGSGVESYRCDHGRARWGGRQLSSGDVVFTHGSALARFTSPLANEAQIPAPAGEYAGSIAELDADTWLVSVRRRSSTHFRVELLQPARQQARPVVWADGEDVVEPVPLAPRKRPNRHPSGLHGWDYANLLALDARISRDEQLNGTPAAVRMETMDARGATVLLGTAPVEKDGSFFVKAPADRPLRFAVLDEHGAILRQERGWFWSRGGEQRICVGCHTGPERASENRVPEVLLRSTSPVDLTTPAAVNTPVGATPSSGENMAVPNRKVSPSNPGGR